ncbi:transcriptional regulator with XRE-family HTH domain [Chryseobacterium sp. 7]|uniref:helix-turn-helix domain-containing protein n=1 Tax=Chryseobacterium sp. 7 TaxID=2035214 RepID=UPI000F258502|nr:helix-turn-helix transcriptional regulator [Chryseobacterium sp. 7]RLJ31168.1 transcriptional regulator with XRE-family HTH domain [Chryseobacterium sp. 7]
MDNTVGKNIKALRTKMQYTQQNVAHYLNISRVELNYYENGKRPIPSHLITKLAELYSVDEYDLYNDDEAALKTNLAFAFRMEELNAEDLASIASFKKIATNYFKMQNVLASNE